MSRRLYELCLLVVLYLLVARAAPDPDFWYHASTGRLIATTGTVPRTDVFSFTQAGREWVAHEWLGQLIIYELFQVGGAALLIVAIAGAIAAAYLLTYWRCRARPLFAGAAVLLGALVSAPVGGTRPFTLTLLLASIFLFLLDHYRQHGRAWALALLPPLAVLWANVHASALLIPVLVGAHLLEAGAERVEKLWRRQPGDGRRVALLAGVWMVCLLALLANVYGPRLYSYTLAEMADAMKPRYITEWQSPNFQLNGTGALAVLLLTLAGANLLRPSPARRFETATVVLLLGLAYATLWSVRHSLYLGLVAAPVLAARLEEVVGDQPLRFGLDRLSRGFVAVPRRIGQVAGAVILAVLLASAWWRTDYLARRQADVERRLYPSMAVDYMQAHRLPPHLFSELGWGGYLIWRLYPDYLVYGDNRVDVHGGSRLEYFVRTFNAQPGWAQRLAQEEVDLVLLSPDVPLTFALRSSSEWHILYSDQRAVLFVRAEMEHAAR